MSSDWFMVRLPRALQRPLQARAAADPIPSVAAVVRRYVEQGLAGEREHSESGVGSDQDIREGPREEPQVRAREHETLDVDPATVQIVNQAGGHVADVRVCPHPRESRQRLGYAVRCGDCGTILR